MTMAGSMMVVMANSHYEIPFRFLDGVEYFPSWGRIFFSLWIAPSIIPECEGRIPPYDFHRWLPVGEVKLFCTTLPS